jgi:hypothetical protein
MDMEHTENYAHTKWKRTVLFYFFFTLLDELDREIERDEEDREGADRETCVREVLLNDRDVEDRLEDDRLGDDL